MHQEKSGNSLKGARVMVRKFCAEWTVLIQKYLAVWKTLSDCGDSLLTNDSSTAYNSYLLPKDHCKSCLLSEALFETYSQNHSLLCYRLSYTTDTTLWRFCTLNLRGNISLWCQDVWIQVLTQLFIFCVTLGKLLNISVFQFCQL
jgi:hypothetical protein